MNKPSLLITGVYPNTDAYPNVYYRVHALQNSQTFITETEHYPAWSSATQSSSGRSRLWRNFSTLLLAHTRVFLRCLTRKRPDITYIPYPAIGVLWLMSLYGKGWIRERIVADAFISIYDTVVHDRKLYAAESLLARLLYQIERRAYSFADQVIVDTPENALYIARLFSLPVDKFCPCPLSTGDTTLDPDPHPTGTTKQGPAPKDLTRILFIGTMIPLHGIATISAATKLLEDEPLNIIVIGDGQEAELLDTTGKNIRWVREWIDSEGIINEIHDADICLGVFGATDKADRVLPYKIYAYSSIGRAIITGATTCLKRLTEELDYSPFYLVPVADPVALANAIRALSTDEDLRRQYASASARFYRDHLSEGALLKTLQDALLGAPEEEIQTFGGK